MNPLYRDFSKAKPSLLQRLADWLVDEPSVVITPYQFRVEITDVAGAGGTIVFHVRERRGEVRVRFSRDELQGLEQVLAQANLELRRQR